MPWSNTWETEAEGLLHRRRMNELADCMKAEKIIPTVPSYTSEIIKEYTQGEFLNIENWCNAWTSIRNTVYPKFYDHQDNSGDWNNKETIPLYTETILKTRLEVEELLPPPKNLIGLGKWLKEQKSIMDLLRWAPLNISYSPEQKDVYASLNGYSFGVWYLYMILSRTGLAQVNLPSVHDANYFPWDKVLSYYDSCLWISTNKNMTVCQSYDQAAQPLTNSAHTGATKRRGRVKAYYLNNFGFDISIDMYLKANLITTPGEPESVWTDWPFEQNEHYRLQADYLLEDQQEIDNEIIWEPTFPDTDPAWTKLPDTGGAIKYKWTGYKWLAYDLSSYTTIAKFDGPNGFTYKNW